MTAPDFTPAQEALLRQAAAQPPAKAAALLQGLATSFWRVGDEAKFVECTRRAAALAPVSGVAALTQDAGDAREHRDQARALVRHGMRDAATLARLGLAQARLGDAEAARRLFDIARFVQCGGTGAPDSVTAADFHAALAREIKAKLTFYERPQGRAIRDGWRHNELFHGATPALQALKTMLERAVARYAEALPQGDDHPFLAARPARLRMEGWAVVSGARTHHTAHIHPDAWATGVFYVVQPPVSRGGRRGWLRIGPPRQAGLGPAQGCDTRMIEPRPGSFVLMPAYFFHDTEPMDVDEERICVAFEVLADDARGVAIRAARPDEAEALSALCLRSKAHWGYDADFLRLSEAALTIAPALIGTGRVLVAERDGVLLGMASLDPLRDGVWDLLHMFVDPAAIGSGVGARLFAAISEMARAEGGTLLSIQADPHAEAFYRRMGARRTGEAPSESVPGRLLPMLEYALT